MSEMRDESEYDGTGTGHEPYGASAYPQDGGARGDEVARSLESELAEQYGADDPGAEHLSDRLLRAGAAVSDPVPRFSEDDLAVEAGGNDQFVDGARDAIDADRHELSAEESAMHFIDGDDPIPE